jgi:cell division protein FtsI (penicillin-binding protein 3)
MTAAEMRKMMEGVVLFGTGKQAQLNGYSSGGKTGTAQKIDPVTHLYSKTMHIASFAGIAPVNNPVISVAVIIDSPKGASYYGAAVSAPVFAEVAQQVLEYLGVPHDTEIHTPRAAAKPELTAAEDDERDQGSDVQALYAAANELPADDPLRAAAEASQIVAAAQASVPAKPATDASPQPGKPAGKPPATAKGASVQVQIPQTVTATLPGAEPKKLKVPSLIGLPMRKVIEAASAAGLDVQVTGTGTVRQQAPAPGTMVAAGTQIVVHCAR